MNGKIRNRTGKCEWAVAVALSFLAVVFLVGEARSWTQCASFNATLPYGVPSTFCTPTTSKTTDCDQDGIPNYYECYGLMGNALRDANNTPGVANSGFRYLGFTEKGSATDCTTFLNPVWRDLFVIVNRASGSVIPNPIKDYLAVYSTNLKVTIHDINEPVLASNKDRYVRILPTVAGGQRAIRLTESPGTNPDFGSGNVGTPNAQDNAKVWTQKIKDYVASICDPVNNSCEDSWNPKGVGKDAVTRHLLEYVLSHEVAHMSKLTKTSTPAYGGYHRAPATNSAGSLMSQTIYVDTAPRPIKFYIPTTITGTTDLTDSKLNAL